MGTNTQLRQGTDEWLEARRAGIGSSDIPVIAGESPYSTPYSLWAEKVGLLTPEPDADQAELFEIGHLMEPVLLSLYERRTGRHPRRSPQMRVSPDLPWAFASLDATAPVRRVVEAKWTHSGRWGDAGVPDDVLLQVQWQLFVTGWDVADVVALKGPRPRIVEVPRDQDYIDKLVTLASDFWQHVESRTPPDLDGSDATRKALTALYPAPTAPALASTPDLATLVAQYVEAKAVAKEATAAEATCANALRAVISTADGIEGLVTYRKNRDSQRTNWPAVAGAYRQLLLEKEVPTETVETIESMHTDTVEGARVLRLLSAKGDAE